MAPALSAADTSSPAAAAACARAATAAAPPASVATAAGTGRAVGVGMGAFVAGAADTREEAGISSGISSSASMALASSSLSALVFHAAADAAAAAMAPVGVAAVGIVSPPPLGPRGLLLCGAAARAPPVLSVKSSTGSHRERIKRMIGQLPAKLKYCNADSVYLVYLDSI